jgi:hypothetical protein
MRKLVLIVLLFFAGAVTGYLSRPPRTAPVRLRLESPRMPDTKDGPATPAPSGRRSRLLLAAGTHDISAANPA